MVVAYHGYCEEPAVFDADGSDCGELGETKTMPFLTTKPLPRRTVLRGIGATLALPLLDAMQPVFSLRARAAAAAVRRFQTLYVPNGMAMEYWTPQGEGSGFGLSPILEPLEPFRNQLLVLSGLKANWNYIHAGASGSFLTGTTRAKI